jgi:demethylmenaquinone methyltransferase/2-methoxy-6-polyprenyl-1,4-benzoquinol methylase
MNQDPREVRRMFGSIAGRYDLLNRLLSLSLDRGWRRAVVRELRPGPGQRALDLCCGTGDLALALSAAGASTVASDFAHPMLERAHRKGPALHLVEADALQLPFPEAAFDMVTIAFGLRNLQDRGAGLREMYRILRPGGQLAVLEFSVPPGRWFRRIYHAYLGRAVPTVGKLVSRRSGPYRYLAETIREFPDQPRLAAAIDAAGFTSTRWIDLTRGIAALHLARRP